MLDDTPMGEWNQWILTAYKSCVFGHVPMMTFSG